MESKEVQTVTAVIGKDHYRTTLQSRAHTLVGDEPLEIGGKDLGPRPGDFVRMALASCTAITLRMYADRKQWPVDQIEVRVSNGPFQEKTTYTSDITITGNLSEEQKERMIQIAKLCPVHKTLTNPVEIITQLSLIQ